MEKLISLLALACFWNAALAQAQETLAVAGTGDNMIVIQALANKFEDQHPGVKVEIPDSVGSSGGIKALQKGHADLARTVRPLKDAEKNGLAETMFGKSPVVFATHPSDSKVNNLSVAQLIDIYSGKITNWQEVGGADAKIYPTSREVGDSSRTTLESEIPAFKDINIKHTSKELFTAGEAVQAIKDHENAIGYSTLEAVNGGGLNVLNIDGKSPIPDLDGKVDYPYMLPFNLVSVEKPTALAQQFIDFCLSAEARSIILANGAIPVK